MQLIGNTCHPAVSCNDIGPQTMAEVDIIVRAASVCSDQIADILSWRIRILFACPGVGIENFAGGIGDLRILLLRACFRSD